MLLVIFLLYYINKISINERIKLNRKNISYLLIIILLLLILSLGLFYIHDRYYFPEPSENQIVVAISPFYYTDKYGNIGSNVNTARDFKERLEAEKDLKLDIIMLDEPLYDIEDAKFQGKKEGAHLVVYGETLETPGGIEKVICYILPLPSVDNILSEFSISNDKTENNLIIETVTFTRFTEKPVELTESLTENVSSTICAIGAFERYINSDYVSAVKFFKAIQNYDRDSIILFYIGNSYQHENNFNKAIETYNKVIKINPQNAKAWNNMGGALWNLGRFEEALIAFEKAIEINPQHVGAWHNKGVALGNLGRFEEALIASEKAIEINPQHVGAWNNKGGALGNLGRFEKALIAFDKAIEINPQYAEAWHNKGGALGNLGRFEEALIASEKAIEINPQHVGAWHNKGVALGNLGRFEEALIASEKTIEINLSL
jgi:tetratricopeptide (TPR) repeat protein